MHGKRLGRTSAIWAVVTVSLLAAQTARADTKKRILFSGNMTPIGMAIDAQGRTHFSWDSTNVRLNYMRIGDGKPVKQVVDPTPQYSISGQRSTIAVDSFGNPHIAYWSQHSSTVMGALFYAHLVGADWQLDQIGQGYPVAMTIDAHNHPRILTGGGEYFHLEDDGWHSETPPLPLLITASRDPSMTVDSAGHVHLGMQGSFGHPVYVTNQSGAWVMTELGTDFSAANSLVLDSQERPHAALALQEVGTIRYRWFDGSEWQSEDVYDPSDLPAGTTNAPMSASLALDTKDRPRILFMIQLKVTKVNRGGFLDQKYTNVLIYAYHDGIEWRLIPIENKRVLEWTHLLVDPTGASQGTYALAKSYLNDTQLVKSVTVAVPDVSPSWNALSFVQEGTKLRADGVLTLRNDGAGRSKAAPIGFYFSNDGVLDGGDTAVAVHKSAPALAPGQAKSVKISFVVPTPYPATQLLAVVDPQARLDDLDRPNNTVAVQLPQ